VVAGCRGHGAAAFEPRGDDSFRAAASSSLLRQHFLNFVPGTQGHAASTWNDEVTAARVLASSDNYRRRVQARLAEQRRADLF
jgi:hypothetical protein